MRRQMIRMGTLNSGSTIAAGGTETNASIRCQSVNCERVKSEDPLAHPARHRILFGDGHFRYWRNRLPLTVSGCVCAGYLSFMFSDQMQRTISKALTSMAKVIERLRWLNRESWLVCERVRRPPLSIASQTIAVMLSILSVLSIFNFVCIIWTHFSPYIYGNIEYVMVLVCARCSRCGSIVFVHYFMYRIIKRLNGIFRIQYTYVYPTILLCVSMRRSRARPNEPLT